MTADTETRSLDEIIKEAFECKYGRNRWGEYQNTHTQKAFIEGFKMSLIYMPSEMRSELSDAASSHLASAETLRHGALIMELFDDATSTLFGDHMLSSTECANVLEGLAEREVELAIGLTKSLTL